MCLSNVYRASDRELIMELAAQIRQEAGYVTVRDLFGASKKLLFHPQMRMCLQMHLCPRMRMYPQKQLCHPELLLLLSQPSLWWLLL